uniref:DNA repair protein SWI5 homolog n=1 Tax=Spongospora subterranea TaxID=70186 RepID=A0A0H5RCK2_9EUKA|eukprot:CRZ11307.1 hypothetical protein [Spongospora subterranea]
MAPFSESDQTNNDADQRQLLESLRRQPVLVDDDNVHRLEQMKLSNPDLRTASIPICSKSLSHRILYLTPDPNPEEEPHPRQLLKRRAELVKQLQERQTRKVALDEYIDVLHRYNEIKDVAQTMLGRLAENERVASRTLYARYGLDPDTD